MPIIHDINSMEFVVLHKINGQWVAGQPTTLEYARKIREGLKTKWPDDEIKIELKRAYEMKQENDK